jgi:hypothetical protein
MHYTRIAFIGCNDAYIPGVEFVPMHASSLSDKIIKYKILAKIWLFDFLEAIGIRKSALLTSVLFKETPDFHLLSTMKNNGWSLRDLPVNPYYQA